MAKQKLSRRRFVASTAAASAALIAAPYVRGAHAAGKLSIGFWDHWVPGANKATEALVNEWAAKEKVEVQMDFIPSQGNKLLLDDRGRSAGQVGSRHHRHVDVAAERACAQPRAGRRYHGRAPQAERQRQRYRAVPWQDQRQLGRRASHGRQPNQGTLLAHRSHEAARRHRCTGYVSGWRAAPRRTVGRSMRS